MVANRALLALLARQDGLITTVQAAQCGLTERALQRRAHDEGWRRVAPRVCLPYPPRRLRRLPTPRLLGTGSPTAAGSVPPVCGPATAE
jgi:hypothetical protein